ncbi:MAG: hypothetical protein ABIP55_07995 [Tepidisphaeraceae bacterium]
MTNRNLAQRAASVCALMMVGLLVGWLGCSFVMGVFLRDPAMRAKVYRAVPGEN